MGGKRKLESSSDAPFFLADNCHDFPKEFRCYTRVQSYEITEVNGIFRIRATFKRRPSDKITLHVATGYPNKLSAWKDLRFFLRSIELGHDWLSPAQLKKKRKVDIVSGITTESNDEHSVAVLYENDDGIRGIESIALSRSQELGIVLRMSNKDRQTGKKRLTIAELKHLKKVKKLFLNSGTSSAMMDVYVRLFSTLGYDTLKQSTFSRGLIRASNKSRLNAADDSYSHNFQTTLNSRLKHIESKSSELEVVFQELKNALTIGGLDAISNYVLKAPTLEEADGDEVHGYSSNQMMRVQTQMRVCMHIIHMMCNRYSEEAGNIRDFLTNVFDVIQSDTTTTKEDKVTRQRQANENYRLSSLEFKAETCMPIMAKKVSVLVFETVKATTILKWYNQFKFLKYKSFYPDNRGKWERFDTLQELNLETKLNLYMKTQKGLSVDKTLAWLTSEFSLPKYEDNSLAISVMPLTRSTVHNWMVKCGASYDQAVKSYYTDRHDTAENISYRNSVYLPLKKHLALREPEWVSVLYENATKEAKQYLMYILDIADEALLPIERKIDETTSVSQDYIKIHVDYLSEKVFETFRKLKLTEGIFPGDFLCDDFTKLKKNISCKHDATVCKCHLPVWRLGQDESTFDEHAQTSKVWKVDGVTHLRPKSKGKSWMCSAVQCAYRGFGLDMSAEELNTVNAFRFTIGKEPLLSSPGIRFLNAGTNLEGWWDYEKFVIQIIDIFDVIDALYPNQVQIAMEVDHSSGHLKKKDNGLDVNEMNLYWGGKQSHMRSTVVTAECLGPNSLLTAGQTQHMVFQEGEDIHIWPGMFSKNPTPPPPKESRKVTVSFGKESSEVNTEGYLGKPKGIYQVLYERGLYRPTMKGRETQTEINNKLLKNLPLLAAEDNAHEVLANCQDFQDEVTALQEIFDSRGHILIISPKCHPEVAGCGIEYSWGAAKMSFRRANLTPGRGDFKQKVLNSICRENVLPITKVWKYDRRTRDYCRMYFEQDKKIKNKTISREDVCYDLIEKSKAVYKTHRNIIDIERVFIDLTTEEEKETVKT